MPSLFSKVFKKDAASKNAQNGASSEPAKPRWNDAWQRTEVEPEEIQELLRVCTAEVKSRAIELPFLLLPFRPASDPSAARNFIRNFFGPGLGNDPPMGGTRLATELRLAEPLVLSSIMKWCWSRLAGGVVTWDAYELFKMGENDSNNARDAFATFIPISTANDARTKIITDFFDLMAAIAAHAKSNGFPGIKLSRYAGWWAFEHKAIEGGFENGYKTWVTAADATTHLFFAYLRSLAPDSAKSALTLPRSLQQLLEQTEYPPSPELSLRSQITKVAMVVDSVSPTPFALLRRAKNFEYRSDDRILQAFADGDDPVRVITDECARILHGIATANDSSNAKLSTSLRDAGWSRFEDIGFAETDEGNVKGGLLNESALTKKRSQRFDGLQSLPASTVDVGRPTTPSWADFMSSGFAEQTTSNPASLLPPDKQLPPISIRGSSSYSDRHNVETESSVGGGELASIKTVPVDDVFWWVWITSLAGEETVMRKSTFGRCAFIETKLPGGVWLLFEEIVKGARAEPTDTGYVAEKKSRFGFRKMSMKVLKNTPTKSSSNASQNGSASPSVRKSAAPDQHARIQAAAAALSQKKAGSQSDAASTHRRGRLDADSQAKTTSTLTLQPVIMSEAAPAMKWASSYDKNEVRSQYLGDKFAGKGSAVDLPTAEQMSASPTPGSRTTQESNAPIVASKSAPLSNAPSIVSKTNRASNEPITSAGSQSVSTPQKASGLDKATPTRKPVAAGPAAPKTPVKGVGHVEGKDDVKAPPRTSSRGQTTNLIPGPEYGRTTVPDADTQPSSPSQTSPATSGKFGKKLPGRFGSVFGRKKTDEEKASAQPTNSSRTSSTPNGAGSAVAAARAALEAKTQQSNASSPLQQVTAKRTSIVNDTPTVVTDDLPREVSKSSHNVPAAATATATAAAAAAAAVHTPIAEPTANFDSLYPEKTYEASYTTDSHIDEAETHAAEREFSKFDHGPMDGSFVSDAAYDPKSSQISVLTGNHSEQEHDLSHGHDASQALPATSGMPEAPSTEVIAQAVENESNNGAPSVRARALSDARWAQIRKNAAERVAARQSEEEEGLQKSSNTEDDGDMSGEETIESRVARIKARVAELTGNMEVPSHNQSEAEN